MQCITKMAHYMVGATTRLRPWKDGKKFSQDLIRMLSSHIEATMTRPSYDGPRNVWLLRKVIRIKRCFGDYFKKRIRVSDCGSFPGGRLRVELCFSGFAAFGDEVIACFATK